ncbi:hypothetical protein KAM429_13690 [Aquipseudomonas alcaligenes]|uniref:Uncharacterized protein n=1 Tax=Aquipseudomonas alcaligenes TaxID=43263 RepID=A0AA37FN48_AQUAC|nr:hypothetical protein KAM426_32530 [Pseudomonas alcaligenes]GIZ66275.1 hypothetical protein KAM428_13600 [Pseudomonas alcaligenes]GIZ70608.1 hypothetical protein KAM429_13690 [Pseudomonas alcaligenes]GIZ74962.1 hypothetical protein KAM430_13710 [Pseudomonas alcaligenes]GIZ79289.1 hypothetical protein KAM432_13370 [Pseudomonas alcaligenes]
MGVSATRIWIIPPFSQSPRQLHKPCINTPQQLRNLQLDTRLAATTGLFSLLMFGRLWRYIGCYKTIRSTRAWCFENNSLNRRNRSAGHCVIGRTPLVSHVLR